MEEKDKIVISTGHEPEDELETPHFDAEETLLAARPVVPLTQEAIEASHSSVRAADGARPLAARRVPVLALVIIAAVSVGLMSGLAIGLYQGRKQQPTTPVAAQPSSATTTVDTRVQKSAEETASTQSSSVQTVADAQKNPEPVVVSQSESGQIVVPEEVPETSVNPRISELPKPERQAAPNRKTPDERDATPPPAATRRKVKDERADDDDGDKKQKSARRRRAVEPERDDRGDRGQRRVERATQELNRIRDIFEGSRP
ncbi:MAG: hypothetical protein WCF57_19425 [Pyrinomonadaceae bacterium]